MPKAKPFNLSSRTFSKRKLLSFLFYFLFLLCSLYVSVPTTIPLPEQKRPFLLYHGPKVPLNQLLLNAVDRCKKSIYIECYAIAYPPLLKKLKKAIDRGVQVEIYFDPKASSNLDQIFSTQGSSPKNLILRAYTGNALMHRKLLIEDGEIVYMGSANFTQGSLLLHENVIVGIQNRALADHLKGTMIDIHPWHPWESKKNLKEGFLIETPQFRARFFKLPEEKFAAQALLYQKLQAAQKTIDVAMFTFTHHKIAHILENRSLEGVQVRMILDDKQKWLSERILPGLLHAGVQIASYKNGQLFHHKWTFIDGRDWIIGSVNWTKNGLMKNSELIAFFEINDPHLAKEIENLWLECTHF